MIIAATIPMTLKSRLDFTESSVVSPELAESVEHWTLPSRQAKSYSLFRFCNCTSLSEVSPDSAEISSSSASILSSRTVIRLLRVASSISDGAGIDSITSHFTAV